MHEHDKRKAHLLGRLLHRGDNGMRREDDLSDSDAGLWRTVTRVLRRDAQADLEIRRRALQRSLQRISDEAQPRAARIRSKPWFSGSPALAVAFAALLMAAIPVLWQLSAHYSANQTIPSIAGVALDQPTTAPSPAPEIGPPLSTVALAARIAQAPDGGTVYLDRGVVSGSLRLDKPVRLLAPDGPVRIGASPSI